MNIVEREASAESKAALQVPHAQNPAPLTSDASPRIIESHQQARYAAQETPIRDKKRSCSKFIFRNFLLIYQPELGFVWV